MLGQGCAAGSSRGRFSSSNAAQRDWRLPALPPPQRRPPRSGGEASSGSRVPRWPWPGQRAASRAASACTCPLCAPPGLSHPFSIDIFEDYIYGVTYINNRIFKIHKFGHKAVTNLTSGLNHATDVVLYHQYKQPEGALGPGTPVLRSLAGGGGRALVSDAGRQRARGALAELGATQRPCPRWGTSGWAERGGSAGRGLGWAVPSCRGELGAGLGQL